MSKPMPVSRVQQLSGKAVVYDSSSSAHPIVMVEIRARGNRTRRIVLAMLVDQAECAPLCAKVLDGALNALQFDLVGFRIVLSLHFVGMKPDTRLWLLRFMTEQNLGSELRLYSATHKLNGAEQASFIIGFGCAKNLAA